MAEAIVIVMGILSLVCLTFVGCHDSDLRTGRPGRGTQRFADEPAHGRRGESLAARGTKG